MDQKQVTAQVADVDTRTATPRDPTLTCWGLARSSPSAPGATRKMSLFYIRNMLRKQTRFFASRSRCEKPLGRCVSPRDGGSVGLRGAIVAAVRPVDGVGPAVGLRNRSPCAQHLRSRALFGWKTQRKGGAIGVSGHLPVRVMARRNEDTRQGTASGNCRSGDNAVAPRRDPPRRRELDWPVPSARSTPPRDLIS